MPRLITPKSVVDLYELTFVEEGEKTIVGRPETEIYVLLPKLGVEIIRAVQKHKRIEVIEKELKKKHGKVEVQGFVDRLYDHGFVKSIDKKFVVHKKAHKKKLLDYIHPKKARWLYSPPMYAVYFMMMLIGLVSLFMGEGYFPSSKDFFFTQYYVVLFPITFLVSWIFVLLHEFGHYIAARSLGLKASFGISHRLHYLVATTSVTNLYSLSRHKRFRVLFGGMLVDLLIISVGWILLFLSDIFFAFHPFIYGMIKFVILIQFLGLLWQFMFFLRTDIYYVFEHWIGIYNLMQKTRQFLMSKIKITFKPHFSKKEGKVVKWYSGFVVFGVVMVSLIFFLYSLPILIELFVNSIGNILRGVVALNFSHFYDKLLFLLFWSINQSFLLFTIIRKHSLVKRPGFYIGILFLFLATNYFVIFFSILLFLVLFSSPFMVYLLAMLLGVASCVVFMQIIKKLNKISAFRVLPEMFVFFIALIYGYFLYELSRFFLVHLGIPGKSSLIIGVCYIVGMFIGYIYMYEKIHEASYLRSIKKVSERTLRKK